MKTDSTKPATESWPRLLAGERPLRGVIKADYEDFEVDEIPLYPADGEGTHTYFLLEKRGLTTMQAVSDVAAALGVRRMDIGYCGLKDARAVTRQWMSVEHVDPAAVQALQVPRMRVLDVTRHRNKLRLGHLRGNSFVIRVRPEQNDPTTDRGPSREASDGFDRSGERRVRAALDELSRRGVPNYFGAQRFGMRGDGWEIGRAIVRSELSDALDILLGRPDDRDHGDIRRARTAYEQGDLEAAHEAWPRLFRDERAALRALSQSRGNKKRAFLAIPQAMRGFFVSAYQSHLFNRIVARRIATGLDRLMLGDLAFRHLSDSVFEVLDVEVEQPRADAGEISPSGPLVGYRMSQPTHEPGEMEQTLLAEESLALDDFRTKFLRVKGGRRPLRFPIADARVELADDERGAYLALRFTLPRGCYATSVLRELVDDTGDASSDQGHEVDDDHRD